MLQRFGSVFIRVWPSRLRAWKRKFWVEAVGAWLRYHTVWCPGLSLWALVPGLVLELLSLQAFQVQAAGDRRHP